MTAAPETLSLVLKMPSDGFWLLEASGELDLSSAHLLHEAGSKAVSDPRCRHLVVDLAAVAFMDSTGLGALIAIRNIALTRHLSFALLNPSRSVAKVLRLTGLEGVFQVAHADSTTR
jgi:anti-sigma B factor antagonist